MGDIRCGVGMAAATGVRSQATAATSASSDGPDTEAMKACVSDQSEPTLRSSMEGNGSGCTDALASCAPPSESSSADASPGVPAEETDSRRSAVVTVNDAFQTLWRSNTLQTIGEGCFVEIKDQNCQWITFSSAFESGNLAEAQLICEDPLEYDLYISPDTLNSRHRVWFYFSVSVALLLDGAT
eukprot:6194193-Pleurochrysis_carterae.AAC.1